MTTTGNASDIVTGYKYGWHDPEFKPINEVKKGLNRDVVAQISELKNHPYQFSPNRDTWHSLSYWVKHEQAVLSIHST